MSVSWTTTPRSWGPSTPAGTAAGNGARRNPLGGGPPTFSLIPFSLAFESHATDLASRRRHAGVDVGRIRIRADGALCTTVLLSPNTSGTGGGNADSSNPIYGGSDLEVTARATPPIWARPTPTAPLTSTSAT